MNETNGIATAHEIQQARRTERTAKGVAVTAPSGARYKLYRPSAGELLVLTGMLPQSIAALLAPADDRSLSLSEQIEIARQRIAVLELVIVEPAVALYPKPGELSILELPEADREFAWKWAYGEIAPDGSDLHLFCGSGTTTPAAG
jgi:hypothetical protein